MKTYVVIWLFGARFTSHEFKSDAERESIIALYRENGVYLSHAQTDITGTIHYSVIGTKKGKTK